MDQPELSGCVLVCGLGQVGFRVVQLLLLMGEDVHVLSRESREDFVERVRSLGAKIEFGDARTDTHLVRAGIHKARCLIACTDSDLTNVEIALDAARLNPGIRIVVRLFDQTLASRLEAALGVHKALAMSRLAAPAFAAAALGESIRGSFVFQNIRFVVSHEMEPQEKDILLSRDDFEKTSAPKIRQNRLKYWLTHMNPLNTWRFIAGIVRSTSPQLKAVAVGILVLNLISIGVFQFGMHLSMIDAFYFVITTVTTTGYGDITPRESETWVKLYVCLMMLLGSAGVATLYSIMTDYIVSARFDQLMGRQRATEIDHVIVVGLGNVGYRTVNELHNIGLEVVVIDQKIENEFRNLVDRKVQTIVGDGRDAEVLKRAGVHSATAVISCTQDDATNLSVALSAKTINPNVRVVVRLFDDAFAAKAQAHLGLDAALSASRIAAPNFVGAALYPDSLLSYVRGKQFFVVVPNAGGGFDILERELAEPC